MIPPRLKTYRPYFRDALNWIADNTNTEWLDDQNMEPPSTLCLVADLFGRDVETATEELRRRVNARRAKEDKP